MVVRQVPASRLPPSATLPESATAPASAAAPASVVPASALPLSLGCPASTQLFASPAPCSAGGLVAHELSPRQISARVRQRRSTGPHNPFGWYRALQAAANRSTVSLHADV